MGDPDYRVELVDSDGNPDMSVAIVGDIVVDLTGATAGEVLTVQPDGTVAADPAGGGGAPSGPAGGVLDGTYPNPDLAPLDIPGVWVGVAGMNAATTIGANVANYVRCFTPGPITVNRIGASIAVSSGNLDMGIYADDGTGLLPGASLVLTGSTASPGTGNRVFSIADTVIPAGPFWIGMSVDNGTISMGFLGVGSGGTRAGGHRPRNQATAFPLPNPAASSGDLTFALALWVENQ